MAQAFASVCPEILAELHRALNARGRPEIAEKMGAAQLERCTYDEENMIGYVYFLRGPSSLHFANLSTPVSETIRLLRDIGFNIDVDHDGDPFGLEFMGRADLVARLKAATEL